jgi:imidazolonepropionase-like amidohydrolase
MTRLAARAAGALLVVSAFSAHPSFAQAPTGSVVALTNARVIDGTGRAPIERATLLISGGRVSAVGPASSVSIPAGATRIDATGKTIVPGFVNAHGHLNVAPGSTMPIRDDLIRRLKMYARYGVTAVVSLDSTERDEVDALALAREQDPARLDYARPYISGMSVAAKTPKDARSRINRLADLKAHAIKFHLNGNPNDMSMETWRAIIDQAHARGLKAAAHIFYLRDARNIVDAGVDVLAHSVRDQDVPPDFIAVVKQKNVAYVPTLTRELSVFVYEATPAFFKDPFFVRGMSLYRDVVDRLSDPTAQAKVRGNAQAQAIKKALEQANRNLKLLSDAGVTIALGTDSGANGDSGRWQGYFEHVEMEMMVTAGMTPMQVLVAATSNAARVMGLRQLGTLEPGNWADLVVLSANPLDNILNTRRIDSVWIAGRRLADVEPVTQTK